MCAGSRSRGLQAPAPQTPHPNVCVAGASVPKVLFNIETACPSPEVGSLFPKPDPCQCETSDSRAWVRPWRYEKRRCGCIQF